jgi:hypothetical protein
LASESYHLQHPVRLIRLGSLGIFQLENDASQVNLIGYK